MEFFDISVKSLYFFVLYGTQCAAIIFYLHRRLKKQHISREILYSIMLCSKFLIERRGINSYFHDFFTFAVLEQEIQELHHSLENKNVDKVIKNAKQKRLFLVTHFFTFHVLCKDCLMRCFIIPLSLSGEKKAVHT